MNITNNCDLQFEKVMSQKILPWCGGLLFRPVFLYIHECGHAMALKVLYSNAHPKITLSHFGWQGFTSHNFHGNPILSSPIGNAFGKKACDFIISVAGPLAELTAALALPILFKSPAAYGLSLPNLLALCTYAITPLIENNLISTHDFKVIKDCNSIAYGAITTGIIALTITVLLKGGALISELNMAS